MSILIAFLPLLAYQVTNASHKIGYLKIKKFIFRGEQTASESELGTRNQSEVTENKKWNDEKMSKTVLFKKTDFFKPKFSLRLKNCSFKTGLEKQNQWLPRDTNMNNQIWHSYWHTFELLKI